MNDLSNMQLIVRSLDREIQRSLREIFTNDIVTDSNKDEYMVEALGVLVSNWTERDGSKIMDVFIAALEDANFHELAEQIRVDVIDNQGSKLYV